MPFKWSEDKKRYAQEYHKKYYVRNKQGFVDRRRAAQVRNKEISDKIKSETPCTDCGKSYHPFVMDFDHVLGKSRDISQMVRAPVSVENLLSEIAKCEVVCANCHRMRTLSRMQETSGA